MIAIYILICLSYHALPLNIFTHIFLNNKFFIIFDQMVNFKIKNLKVIAYVLRVHNYLPLSTYINSIILLYWGTYFSIACRSHFFSNAMIDAKFAPFFKTFYDLFCVVRGQFTSHFALYKLYILHEKPLILFRYLDFCFIGFLDFFFLYNIQVYTYYGEKHIWSKIHVLRFQSFTLLKANLHQDIYWCFILWWNIFLKDGHTVQTSDISEQFF